MLGVCVCAFAGYLAPHITQTHGKSRILVARRFEVLLLPCLCDFLSGTAKGNYPQALRNFETLVVAWPVKVKPTESNWRLSDHFNRNK